MDLVNQQCTRGGGLGQNLKRLLFLVVCLMSVMGCAGFSPEGFQKPENTQKHLNIPQDINDLAGTWEYTDNTGSHTITLNAEGKGAYEWEEGRFETHSLESRLWAGVWIQERNDREGGFELTFSDDSSVAEGNWWYTRIGTEHDPLQPGGTFKMRRSSPIYLAK